MASRSIVLIGRGRRITLGELQSVALYGGGLELHSPGGGEDVADAGSSSSAVEEGQLSSALSALKIDGCGPLLSPAETLASLTVLALTISQDRAVAGDKAVGNGASPSSSLSSALIDVVNAASSGTPLRLPRDPSEFLTSASSLPLLSSVEATLRVDGGDAPPSSATAPLVGRAISLASACLAAAEVRTLARAADGLASLSAERIGVDPTSAYSESAFDASRPHRGLVTSAANLRACLNGSRFATKAGGGGGGKKGGGGGAPSPDAVAGVEVDAETLRAVRDVPQYHGPASEAVLAACKTLELEVNCSEAALDVTLDNTVACIALASCLNGAVTLLDGARARSGTSLSADGDGEEGGVKGGEEFPTGRVSDLSSLAMALSSTASDLKEALESEARINATFVAKETAKAEEEKRRKDEVKASREADMAAKKKEMEDKDIAKLAAMSEGERAKVLKKRADKEAKAKAKAAKKNVAQGGGSAGDGRSAAVSIFGAGTLPIISILTESSFSLTVDAVASIEAMLAQLLSGGAQRKPKIAKGTRDYLPEQMMIRDRAFQIIRRVFKSHGAVEIDTPVFELRDTLTGKYGEDSKLIYDLADQGGELLALRYDLTVPFARFLALNSVGNIKRYHIGKVYRRDQPQIARGRYREFYQCDFDIAGTYGRMVPDSECVAVACDILSSLPIGDFSIKLNHRCLLDAILDICGVPADKFRTICSAVDKLDKEPWEEVKREMVEDKGLKAEVADRIGTFVVRAGEPRELYKMLMDEKAFGDHNGAAEAMEDLRILFEYLDAMDRLQYVRFDLSLARGLDYYTGVIYEAVCVSGDTQVGSIGGGGRYDNLVGMFQEAGKATPCVGVSVGIERVFTLMEARLRAEQGGHIKQPNVSVLVASIGTGTSMVAERMRLARLLWSSNVSAEFNMQENPKLKFEIADALERDIPFMAIVGEEELRDGTCKVKDLRKRTEETVKVSDLVKTLRAKGVVPVGCEFAAEIMGMSGEGD